MVITVGILWPCASRRPTDASSPSSRVAIASMIWVSVPSVADIVPPPCQPCGRGFRRRLHYRLFPPVFPGPPKEVLAFRAGVKLAVKAPAHTEGRGYAPCSRYVVRLCVVLNEGPDVDVVGGPHLYQVAPRVLVD